MSIAIQWGYDETYAVSQGFIYFDAVTAYKKQFSGSVSKHPIDGGGNITDHFTRDNPIITFSGVISGVDISSKWKNILDENGNSPTNLKSTFTPVKINSNSNPFIDILPASITQFFRPAAPSVSMASQSLEVIQSIQEQLESLFEDGKIKLITLYEYKGNSLKRRPIKNLVVTSISFTTNVESGDALFCDFTIEQVTFASIRKGQIPKDISEALVAQDLKNKAATTQDGGKVDSTVNSGIPENLARKKVKTSIAAKTVDVGKDLSGVLFGGTTQ